MADNPNHNSNGGEPESAPPIVMPVPGMPSAGIANLPDTAPGSLISPQPFVESGGASGAAFLADRIEQALAEDGRFAAFLPHILVTVDGGLAHLSGRLPTLAQKQSLLAAVRAVPGVATVSDALSIG